MAHTLNLTDATELLTLLGVEGVVVAADANEDVDIDNIANSVQMSPATKALLQKEIEAEIKAAADGKWLGALRSKIGQRFGVKTSSLSELTIEEMLDMAKGNVEGAFTASQKQMLEDRQKLIDDYENEKQNLISLHSKELAESNAKYIRRDMMQRCVQMLNGIPQTQGDITKKADALLAYIERNYSLGYDDANGSINISDKNDATRPVLQGKSVLTDAMIADNYATEMGWKVADTRNTPPASITQPAVPQGQPNIDVNPKMVAAAQNVLNLLSQE